MKKRVLSLLLAALLLSASFVACAGNGDVDQPGTNVTTAAPDTTLPPETEPVDARDTADLPAGVLPADGFKLRILTLASSVTSLTELAPETANGETLNDALYERKIKLADDYGIEIVPVITKKIKDTFANAVLSSSDDFEAAANSLSGMVSLVANGQVVDLNSMEYINLEKNYWDQNALRDLEVKGRMYFGIGDINVGDDDSVMIMLYNTSLANQVGVENLYDAVRDGRWTYDLMLKYVDQVSNDVDGNGTMNENDVIGYLYASNRCFAPHAAAADLRFVSKDSDGNFTYTPDVDKLQKLVEILNKLHDPSQNGVDWLTAADQVAFITGMVSNKQVLFQNMVTSQLRRLYPDVTADFGVLPMPKFDEEQENHQTVINEGGVCVVAVPTSNPRLDLTGYALEAMAEASDELTDAYYEICLASKYTRDPESFEMISIGREGLVYDPARVYGWGKLYTTLNGLVKSRGENVASMMDTLNQVVESEMADFAAKIGQ